MIEYIIHFSFSSGKSLGIRLDKTKVNDEFKRCASLNEIAEFIVEKEYFAYEDPNGALGVINLSNVTSFTVREEGT